MNGMETRSSKRKKLLNLNAEDTSPKFHVRIQDKISDLPDDVLHHILSFLPIKSVAKTSILSKRWRDVWYSFPNLDFTTANAIANALLPFVRKPRMGKEKRSCFLKGSKYIEQIIGLLEKHSAIRVLKFRFVMSFSGLNSLIRCAIRHDVQELDMEISTFDYFNLPRSVIKCETLRVFRLKSLYPGFRLPPVEIMKHGFKSLCTLSLSGPFLHDHPSMLDLFTDSSFPSLKILNLDACSGLRNLRIKCPRLEDLSIDGCYQMQDLEISVQKLERLRVTRCFFTHSSRTHVKIDAPMLASILWSDNSVTDESVLQNLTSLHKARVEFRQGYHSPVKMKSALNFLSGISHCQQSLTLEGQCIEVLASSTRYAAVPLSPFHKLRSLELFMMGFHKHNISGMAKIFSNSPTINTVVITICGYRPPEQIILNKELWETWSSRQEMKYWESQIECFKFFSHHLKVVKINGFSECVLDLSFVKFILQHGEVLQQVFLSPTVSTKQTDSLLRENFRSQIMGFTRASPDATIEFQ